MPSLGRRLGHGHRLVDGEFGGDLRILAIHETAAAINSTIADAYIGFSTMTCPLVAVVTDVVREGKPVVGFGFSSNGSCAAGAIMRERMMPRLLGVPPDTLLGPATGLTDPFRARDAMMTNQKPGGHIERSVAVGTLDKAIWRQGDLATRRSGDKAIWRQGDLACRGEGRGLPLWRLLADRYRDGRADPDVRVYAAGGYHRPGTRRPDADRCRHRPRQGPARRRRLGSGAGALNGTVALRRSAAAMSIQLTATASRGYQPRSRPGRAPAGSSCARDAAQSSSPPA